MKIEMIEMMKIKYLNNGLFSVTACLMLYDIVVMGDELRIFDKERDVCIYRDGVLLATIHNDPDSFKTFIDEIKKTGIITVSHFPSKPHGTPRFKVGDKVFILDESLNPCIRQPFNIWEVNVENNRWVYSILEWSSVKHEECNLFSSRVELARELDRRQGVNADE
jgi:hypothetical protein